MNLLSHPGDILQMMQNECIHLYFLIQPSSSMDFYISLLIGFVAVLIHLQVSSSPHWSHIDSHKVWIKYTILQFRASKSYIIPCSTKYGFL